ncbi:hypothetical protein [Peribacillus sp. SCS-155]|uniref:hypothetical protein n=1 Tax=Peribacillus sedimenti TaxID=3115297 RepID=UPI003906046A
MKHLPSGGMCIRAPTYTLKVESRIENAGGKMVRDYGRRFLIVMIIALCIGLLFIGGTSGHADAEAITFTGTFIISIENGTAAIWHGS